MQALLKALALPVVALSLVSASIPRTTLFVNYPAIEQIVCLGGKGTGFHAGGKFISVTHVTENIGCRTASGPVVVTDEAGIDFSTGPSVNSGYHINCGGFRKGAAYFAIGYAGGAPVQQLLTLTATGEYADNGMAILHGYPTVIPGMSGGPILNARGEVVGTVNMFTRHLPLSFSQELRETSLCSPKPA